MIEATCSACGTLNRVTEASVPVGSKFITCADCKSRIALGGRATPPAIPKPGARPSEMVGLADLPAPKRASALGAEPSRPAARPPALPAKPVASRSGLAAALDPDLPAPKPLRSTQAMAAVAPPTVDLDDPRGVTLDQPAPPFGSAAARGQAPLVDDIDLPAPKKPMARASEPTVGDLDVMDLPMPKADRGITDLPAPKRTIKRAVPEMPAARPVPVPPTISDLPAPKRGPNIPDVPTPRMADLAPKQYGNQHGNADLPA